MQDFMYKEDLVTWSRFVISIFKKHIIWITKYKYSIFSSLCLWQLIFLTFYWTYRAFGLIPFFWSATFQVQLEKGSFAVLQWEIAAASCRENFLWLFAVGFFLYASKPFFCVSNFFLCKQTFFKWKQTCFYILVKLFLNMRISFLTVILFVTAVAVLDHRIFIISFKIHSFIKSFT